jgi:hypothetical protein
MMQVVVEYVIPAEAGIQGAAACSWTPAFAGVTYGGGCSFT